MPSRTVRESLAGISAQRCESDPPMMRTNNQNLGSAEIQSINADELPPQHPPFMPPSVPALCHPFLLVTLLFHLARSAQAHRDSRHQLIRRIVAGSIVGGGLLFLLVGYLIFLWRRKRAARPRAHAHPTRIYHTTPLPGFHGVTPLHGKRHPAQPPAYTPGDSTSTTPQPVAPQPQTEPQIPSSPQPNT
ncbi:hypothetical protein B0H17DRAFT_1212777 [Mycena rosella]|uniref:Uncharacterized protein n=1 Tax=Mycena rosella TaxID=1033263 RepID=A0AAD7G666_MYCRO|nr:hypothetical protein B0H17DRAFT_1212777 [Mycena rosella]